MVACGNGKDLSNRSVEIGRRAGSYEIGAAGWSVGCNHEHRKLLDGASQWRYLGAIEGSLCLFLRWEFGGHDGSGSYTRCFHLRG